MFSDSQRQQDQIEHATPMSRRSFLHATGGMIAGGALLAACGGAAGGAGTNITLTHYNWEFGETGTHEAMLRYFSDYHKTNSDVNVKLQWIPGDYQAKLNAGLVSSSPPDTFLGTPDPNLVQQGHLSTVDDLFSSDVLSDFNSSALNSFKLGSHYYGVPILVDTMYLYYRKSMLAKAGVQPPQTLADLAKAAKATTTGNVKGLFLGNDSGTIAVERGVIWSAGTDYIANNQVAFATQKVADGITTLRDMSKNGALLQDAPTDWYDATVFLNGLVAMQYTGLWAMPAIIKALGDDVGILPWPAADSSTQPSVPSLPAGFIVNAKAKHVDASKALTKSLWITNTQVQQDWNVGYGFHIPPRKSAATSAAKLKTGLAAEGVQMLNQYGHIIPVLWTSTMGTYLSDAIGNILKKNANALSTLTTAQQKCQAELSKLPTFS